MANILRSIPLVTTVLLFFMSISPAGVFAVELIVEQSPTDTSHFSSIQAAINEANRVITANTGTTTSYTIIVEPGTYIEAITLYPKISVRGRETARTILSGGGSGPVISATNVTSVSIKNFTIIDASVGIRVTGSTSSVIITNNVFQVGTAGTAVQIQTSPSAEVVNNTFYQNGIGVQRDVDTIKITNNIFANNATAVSQGGITSASNILNNGFFSNTVDGQKGTDYIPNATITGTDPLFVNTTKRDFHLLVLSPAIDTGLSTIIDVIDGTPSDMGAYGGGGAAQDMDTIPFPVASVTAVMPDSSTVAVSWAENKCFLVRGYRVWYGKTPGTYDGIGAVEGASPITAITTTNFTMLLTGLTTSVVTPDSPVLDPPQVANQSLVLNWTAATGATSYRVYYGTSSPPSIPIDVGNTTTYTLGGLVNGTTYHVAVSAVASSTIYVTVTAFYKGSETRSSSVIPGKAYESAYSDEASVSFGSPQESGLSNVRSDFPEALTPYPILPNKGCFIATAAYGHYSEPEVQVLREFRDRFLITHWLGRVFVRGYYSISPAVGELIREHPRYKPVVRAVLYPVVGAAMMATKAPWLAATAVAVFVMFTALFIILRQVRRRRGESCERY